MTVDHDQMYEIMTETSVEPLVSVVVVNYNGRHLLEDCFHALNQQTYGNFEIILVDNGSHDDSITFMKEHYPRVRIVQLSSNTGFAGGTNAGIRSSHGELILTLNNDTCVFSDFIEKLIQPMVRDTGVGMCASKMISPDKKINSTGICLSRSGAAWDRGGFEQDTGQYDDEVEIFGPCAGAALYRKTMLDEIGLFDEDFFLFMEDVDLAFRAQLAGWKCVYTPKARVIHKHGGTARAGSDIAVYYGNRNILWYVVKNFPFRTLVLSSPWIIGRNIGVIPYYILRGKHRIILKAKIDAIKNVHIMAGKRKSVKKVVSDSQINRWIQPWSCIPEQK
jgi:GT2 family glycosyltransferase